MKTREKALPRRQPKQERARQTVEAVLEAVSRVLQRQGADAITTNRVAEAAGVSIGSLYQYFPDKQAIFKALHERHVDGVRQAMERTARDFASASLDEFASGLVERLADLHSVDAELHELVSAVVPSQGFRQALRATFARAISPGRQARYQPEEAERILFVLPQLVEALVHGVAQQSTLISRARAKDEALRTVAGYLRAYPAVSFLGNSPAT